MDDAAPLPDPQDAPPGNGRRRLLVAGAAVAALALAGVGIGFAVGGSGSHHGGAAAAGGGGAVAGGGAPGSSGPGGPAPSGASTSTTSSAGGSRGSGTTTGPGAASGTTAPGATTPGGGATSTTVRRPGVGPTRATLPPTTTPLSITQAYVQGYQGECRALWSQAGPSGKLWDADSLSDPPHTVDECLSELDPTNAEIWSDFTPADARSGGVDDADSNAQDMTVGNRFQNADGLVIYIP